MGNGLPRFRALARMTAMERFSATAMLAAEQPSSISTSKCTVWAAVHFRLAILTMGFNPADQVLFDRVPPEQSPDFQFSESCRSPNRHSEANLDGLGLIPVRAPSLWQAASIRLG